MNNENLSRIKLFGTAFEVIKKSGKEYSKYIYFSNSSCLATFIGSQVYNFPRSMIYFRKYNSRLN